MGDDFFRTCIVIAMFVLFPTALYYRVKSQQTGEKLDRRKEGLFVLLTLRPVALVWIFAFFVYIVSPVHMEWAKMYIAMPVRWLALGVAFLSGVLLIWTQHTLGTNLTDTVVTRANANLVTHGPYRWVRHPYYVAFFMAVVGNSLVADNAFLLILGLAAFWLIYFRTKTEERFLVERFGDSYREYMATTGRFFPKWR